MFVVVITIAIFVVVVGVQVGLCWLKPDELAHDRCVEVPEGLKIRQVPSQ